MSRHGNILYMSYWWLQSILRCNMNKESKPNIWRTVSKIFFNNFQLVVVLFLIYLKICQYDNASSLFPFTVSDRKREHSPSPSDPPTTCHAASFLLPSPPFCQGATLLLNYPLGPSVSTHSNKVFLQGLGWRRLI